jgi:hypothetical protein
MSPKQELYEPLWDELYQRSAQSGIRIRSIWIADMWNQGQSGVLNEGIMGNDRVFDAVWKTDRHGC